MHCTVASSNTNSMPALLPSDLRCMRPCMRELKSAATSAWMRCMPALSCTAGNSACAAKVTAKAAAAISFFKRRSKKKKAGSLPCLSLRAWNGLLLVHLGVGLLGVGLLGVRLLLAALLLVRLLLRLLLHLGIAL